MQQPTYILNNGTRVRTHAALGTTRGMMINQDALDSRRTDADGVIVGVVGGHGGDVYWVRHVETRDDTTAPYCFDEFELVKL